MSIVRSVKFVLGLVILIVAFQILFIFVDDKDKTKYNACRDKGGSPWYCVTGVRL
jgi:hypothetical protein